MQPTNRPSSPLAIFSLAAFLAVAAAALSGCSSQRSLETVRASGDHAFEYGQYEKARADYAEVVDRAPSDWRARVNLGKTMLVLEQPKPAREQLAIAHSARPNDEEIVDLYAQAMLEAGDKDGMFRLLRSRAEEFRTANEYLRFGTFALKAEDVDEAERALLTAARLDGGKTVGPQLALSELYAKIGDEARALRRLRMALFIEPGNMQVQDRIRSLGQIPGPTFVLQPEELQ